MRLETNSAVVKQIVYSLGYSPHDTLLLVLTLRLRGVSYSSNLSAMGGTFWGSVLHSSH